MYTYIFSIVWRESFNIAKYKSYKNFKTQPFVIGPTEFMEKCKMTRGPEQLKSWKSRFGTSERAGPGHRELGRNVILTSSDWSMDSNTMLRLVKKYFDYFLVWEEAICILRNPQI